VGARRGQTLAEPADRAPHRVVRWRTRLRNQIHAVLTRNLIEVPVIDVFGRAGRR